MLQLQRDSKLGYGYMLVSIAAPPLVDHFFGHTAGLIAYVVSLLAGVAFLSFAHADDIAKRRSLKMTVFVFSLYGMMLGGLGGGLIGAIAHSKAEKSERAETPTSALPIHPKITWGTPPQSWPVLI